jgi:acyl transferase domain-containing protein
MLEDFRAVARSLRYAPPRVPVVSNLTGALATADDLCSSDYWVRHVRGAVRFADGVRAVRDHGATALLEIGPDGTAAGMARDCLPADDPAVVVSAARRGRPEVAALTAALGELSAHGVDVDWTAVLADRGGEVVDLPTYAFQSKRFWLSGAPRVAAAVDVVRPDPAEPSLVDRLAALSGPERTGLLLSVVRGQVAVVLGYDTAADVEPSTPFAELGMDSLAVVRLRNALTGLTGVQLPVTVTYERPSAAALAEYLAVDVLPADRDSVDAVFRRLDDVEAALPLVLADRSARSRLASRLRTLTGLLDGDGDDGDGDGEERVSDEELFHLLDEEFGL